MLSQLTRGSSAGPDGLFLDILKYCHWELAPSISDIFNNSLTSCKSPSTWHNVRITSIPKSQTVHSATSKYRPISFTYVLCKTFQNAILNFLKLTPKAAFDPLQFASKSKRSTLDAMATLFHQITFSLDKAGGQLRCAFLDCSSAFNTVPHQKIADSLSLHGASH